MMGMEEGDKKVTVVPREYFGDIKLERGMTLRAQMPRRPKRYSRS